MKTKVKTLKDHLIESKLRKQLTKKAKDYTFAYLEKSLFWYLAFLAFARFSD